MVYPDHQLLQISGFTGTAASPIEIWSTGIRTVASTSTGSGGTAGVVLTEEQLEEYLDLVQAPLLAALALGDKGVAGGNTKITTLKYNQLDANGHYLYDTTVERQIANAPFGTSTQVLEYPTQVSKVLTLETGFTRGHAHRGRMYIPNPSNSLSSSTGLFSIPQTEVTAWAAVVGLLERTLTTPDGDIFIQPAVVSGVGTGFAWRPITGVSMDNRPDIQRRRANDIQGTRLVAPLP